MDAEEWGDVGAVDELSRRPLQQVLLGRTPIALVFKDGKFSAVSGRCNHVGGPLGEGRLEGDYVVCPWHYWKFHCRTGEGEPGYESDRVPVHEVRVEDGRVLVRRAAATNRSRKPHEPHPLARTPRREEGPIRVLGLSTTAMTAGQPRYSTSEDLLESGLHHASEKLGCETRLIAVRDLRFRECEGYYSKSSRACTWPCSITQMDPNDQMEHIYEHVVHWADVIVVSTPIRWGGASSLYYKMVERMNCIQNQETIANRHLLPYVAHSRGWSAEDMENNERYVRESVSLHEGAAALVSRCVDTASLMIKGSLGAGALVRGGRKGHELDTRAQIGSASGIRS